MCRYARGFGAARDVVLLDVCDAAIRAILDAWDDRFFTVGLCRLNQVDP